MNDNRRPVVQFHRLPSRLLRQLPLIRTIPVLALVLAACFSAQARAADLSGAVAATLVVYSDDLDEAFLGSAFLWGDGTLAVTNAHVVGAAKRVELRAADGRRLSAPVVARDVGRDIALIAVEAAAFGPGLVPAAALPGPGAPVWAVGSPLGAAFSVSAGSISAVGRQVEPATPVRYLQHDAAVNPGSSGGPLVDAEGRLVGMNSLIADGSRLFVGIAYAMTAQDIARLVPALAEGSLRPVPDLRLRLRPVSRKVAAALGVPAGQGLLVDAAEAGGLAWRAGLAAGDLVLTLDGVALAEAGDLALALDARVGDRPVLGVLRQGARIELAMDLAVGEAGLTAGPGAAPVTIDSYTLAGLGIRLDGAAVTGLTDGSPADFAGLTPGDTLLALNGRPVARIDLAALEVTGPLLILAQSPAGQTRHIVVDPWGKGRGPRAVGGANVLDPAVVLF
jgi:serine protease Do